MEDMWNRNAVLIKRLYQDENHTLKEVRKILQEEYHFPVQPLSTYEIKIREVIKARKYLKKKEWESIHMFALSRGYREYDVSVNGKIMRTELAWRYVRRSGAHKLVPHGRFPRGDLPPGVEVIPRTRVADGPPDSPNDEIAESQIDLPQTNVLKDNDDDTQLQTSPTSTPRPLRSTSQSIEQTALMQPPPEEAVDLSQIAFYVTYIETIHDSLPWNIFRRMGLALLNHDQDVFQHRRIGGVVLSYLPNDGFFPSGMEKTVARFSSTIYPTLLDLSESLAPCQARPTPMSWYRQVAILTYIISNGLHDMDDAAELFNLLGAALYQLPREVATRLIMSNTSSIKALWDRFTRLLVEVGSTTQALDKANHTYLSSLTSLAKIVLDIHPSWKSGIEHKLLFLAASQGKTEFVRYLLPQVSREQAYSIYDNKTAIIGATAIGAQDCVRLLIRGRNVNTPRITIREQMSAVDTSEFIAFLRHIMGTYQTVPGAGDFSLTLGEFLHVGADANAPYPPELCGLRHVYESMNVPQQWVPTCLDISFYFCQPLFDQMHSWNLRSCAPQLPDRSLTRRGVCTATLGGVVRLEEYMRQPSEMCAAQKRLLLELVLIEQFFLTSQMSSSRRLVKPGPGSLNPQRAAIASVLIQHGVVARYDGPCSDDEPVLLAIWLKSVHDFGLSDDMQVILSGLARSSPTPTPTALILRDSVQEEGLEVLDKLLEFGVVDERDIAILGAEALAQAAKYDNLEAVSWFLDKGVDINAEIKHSGNPVIDHRGNIFYPDHKVTVIANCLGLGQSSNTMFSSLSTCRYLVSRGAKLRRQLLDSSCLRLMTDSLDVAHMRRGGTDSYLALLRFFDGCSGELENITVQEWNGMLRGILVRRPDRERDPARSDCWNIFVTLFERYYTPDCGPILSPMVVSGCSRRLFHRVLDKVLALGGSVDEFDPHNGTPLQVALLHKRLDLASHLMGLGADANATPGMRGRSALYNACLFQSVSSGEKEKTMDMIKLLVSKGAHVDGIARGRLLDNPLQACAEHGFLEGATFLLQLEADPNVLTLSLLGIWKTITSLDIAVANGRLEMVQLLVKAGALSGNPGLTGYDDAMKNARSMYYDAIESLLRKHVAENDVDFEAQPLLQARHQAMIDTIRQKRGPMLASQRNPGSRVLGRPGNAMTGSDHHDAG